MKRSSTTQAVTYDWDGALTTRSSGRSADCYLTDRWAIYRNNDVQLAPFATSSWRAPLWPATVHYHRPTADHRQTKSNWKPAYLQQQQQPNEINNQIITKIQSNQTLFTQPGLAVQLDGTVLVEDTIDTVQYLAVLVHNDRLGGPL